MTLPPKLLPCLQDHNLHKEAQGKNCTVLLQPCTGWASIFSETKLLLWIFSGSHNGDMKGNIKAGKEYEMWGLEEIFSGVILAVTHYCLLTVWALVLSLAASAADTHYCLS